MNIYISGSMAYDRIMDFPGRFSDHILPDKIHILNVCFTVNGLVEKFGGTAGNIAYSLSLLKEKPVIVATIGKDYEPYFKWLRQNGIATDGIKVVEEEFTAGAYITTDKADNQITGFNPGAMKHQAAFDFNNVDPSKSIVIIAAGNLNDMRDIASACKNSRIQYICDPGQSLTAWDKDGLIQWLNGSFMLITNDYELEMIMNLTGLDKKSLLAMTKTIITTLGEKGSLISAADDEFSLSAVKASDVVDPTGAGDAFRAGLLKGIAAGSDVVSSAKIGAVAAVYAVEKYGTQEHSYSLEEFASRYRSAFGEDMPTCF
jgi:adenosine kinase